jgi:ubiquinone/menaquinone biosynthesis C-methylase UbiE
MNSDLAFKIGDAESYREVSDLFDHYTQRFSCGFAKYLYEAAGRPANVTALDVGTGSGVVALEVSRNTDSESSVIGIDLSMHMLNQATQKAHNVDARGTIDFVAMDAENLAFPDNHFDTVFSLYALRHFPNPDRALAEMYRVLMPGGRIVVGIGSPPSLLSLMGIKAGFRRLLSMVRRASGREANACEFIDDLIRQYIPQSQEVDVAKWTEQHHNFSKSLSEMVRSAGFVGIQSGWVGQRSIIDSVEDFFLLQVTFSSLARKRLARADEMAIKKLRAEFNSRCAAIQQKGGRLVYQSGAAVVSAIKES